MERLIGTENGRGILAADFDSNTKVTASLLNYGVSLINAIATWGKKTSSLDSYYLNYRSNKQTVSSLTTD